MYTQNNWEQDDKWFPSAKFFKPVTMYLLRMNLFDSAPRTRNDRLIWAGGIDRQ